MACGTVNKKLFPMKILIFLFYGGMGCLWPFLNVQMKQLGMSVEETAIINMLLPFISAAAIPLISACCDKFGLYKQFFVTGCILTAVFYHSLLFVPPVQSRGTFPINHLRCDSEKITLFTDECSKDNYTGSCGQLSTRNFMSNATLHDCSFVCDSGRIISDDSMYLCLSTEKAVPEQVCKFTNISLEHKISIGFRTNTGEQKGQYCTHKVNELYDDNVKFTSSFCRMSYNHDCYIQCAVVTDVPSINSEMICHLNTGDPVLTFWFYLVLRGLAEICIASIFPILDSINIAMCKEHGGHFGRQQLFGVVSIGMFAPFAGYLIDYFIKEGQEPNFAPSFYVLDVLMLATVIITCFIQFSIGERPRHLLRDVTKLFTRLPIILLFFAVLTLGTIWGYIETFLYWYLADLGGSRFLMGLTLSAGVLPGLPFLYYSTNIIKKVGHANILILAFYVYAVRCIGYSLIVDPWWCLPYEALEIFTIFLPRVAFSLYASVLAPSTLIATTQAVVILLHYNIGRGLGSLLGGYGMEYFGSRQTFMGAAVVAGIGGAIYMCLHHLVVKPMILRRKTHNRGVQTNGAELRDVRNSFWEKNADPLLNSRQARDSRNGHY